MSPAKDSTTRFSDRVENYVRYRPGYPEDVVTILQEVTGLTRAAEIADIGSGTGISAELFLRNGNSVVGVEPNAEMRAAGERILRAYARFRSVSGTAEATTLADMSIDYVLAAQAFHWFDLERARDEFRRILRPEGWVVLLWNSRRTESTAFLRAYERLLQRFGTDYGAVQHTNIQIDDLRPLFLDGRVEVRSLPNEQRFGHEGLLGRLLSSSYVPAAGHPNHAPMLVELERIFSERRALRLDGAAEGSACAVSCTHP